MREAVFLSDLHIGDRDFPTSKKALFFDFIDNYLLKRDVIRLYLLGDIFELLQSSLLDIYKEHLDIILKFVEIAKRTEIVYILGNHDLDFTEIKGRKIDLFNFRLIFPRIDELIIRGEVSPQKVESKKIIKTLTTSIREEIFGKILYLAHGHEYNHYFCGDPKRYDYLIRVGGFIEECFGPESDDKLLSFYEKLKDKFHKIFFEVEDTPKVKGLRGEVWDILAARDILKFEVCEGGIVSRREKLDFVIFGHTHKPRIVEVRDNLKDWCGEILGIYVNTGSWTLPDRGQDFFSIMEDGSFGLFRYLGEGRARRYNLFEPNL